MFLGWDPADQDKALAWRARERSFCDRCGTRESDWTGPDGRLLDAPRWEPTSWRCPGCAEVDRYDRALPDEMDRAGMSVRLVARGEVTRGDETV